MARAVLAALAVVAVAGCGSSHQAAPPAAPKLPRALAARLASESEALADALSRGDECDAGRLAGRLRSDATASIGRVPAALQEPLSSGVNAAVEDVPACKPPVAATTGETSATPPATPPPEPAHAKGHEKKEKHGEHHHGKKGGDD